MACKDKITAESVSKCLCVVLLVLQSSILDYYLIENHSLAWIGFVLVDIVIIVLWIAALYTAFTHHQRQTNSARKADKEQLQRTNPDELKVAYLAWLVYAVGYTVQVSFIFKKFASKLDNAGTSTIFGQNMLKLSLAITPMLFLLLVHAHHDAAPHSMRKYYIEILTGSVTIDLMDSIEILEILFTDLPEHKPSTSFENTIIAFACINVFLPTFALHAVKQKKTWNDHFAPSKLLYNLCYIFLVNVPFFIIRVLLWAHYKQDVSVFLAKNIILIVMNSWDIVEHCWCRKIPSQNVSPSIAIEDISTQPSGESEVTSYVGNFSHENEYIGEGYV